MIIAVEIVAVVVVVLVAAVVLLRFRKLHRDGERERSRTVDRRLMTPPPSPYATSKGFRLIDETGQSVPRREPARPRLEPDREYIFSDNQVSPLDLPAQSASRQRDNWALSRSAHRPKVHVTTSRIAAAVVVIAIIAGAGAYGVSRLAKHHGASTPSTSTTTSVRSITTTIFPKTFSPVATGVLSATYNVPVTKYRLAVTAVNGPTWVRFVMGPQSTLEFQGTIARDKSEQLSMTGDTSLTIGSPGNAAVNVDGVPVVLPKPLPSTLTLHFVVQRQPG